MRRCVRWGPSFSPQKGTAARTLFSPCLLWPNGRPAELLLLVLQRNIDAVQNRALSSSFLQENCLIIVASANLSVYWITVPLLWNLFFLTSFLLSFILFGTRKVEDIFNAPSGYYLLAVTIKAATTPCYLHALTVLERCNQPVATCRQSPYLRPVPSATKPAILIVTSFSLWRPFATELATPSVKPWLHVQFIACNYCMQ